MVIDLFGLTANEVRARFPEVYQHLLTTVKSARDAQAVKSDTKDAKVYATLWWLFGKPRQELRPALSDLKRYIATVETTKHRVFQFIDATILPDNMLVAIASDDAFILGVLSSKLHVNWAIRAGGRLGMGNDPRYSKSRTFDPFPFPVASPEQVSTIRRIAEDLDAHRKRVLSEQSLLTLTALYNVLGKLRVGVKPEALKVDDRRIFDSGLVLILKELHDRLDAAVAEAYGWPVDLADEEIFGRLVALNKERAAEEARGLVRWLRPDYQIPLFGRPAGKKEQIEAEFVDTEEKAKKPSFPADDMGQTAMVMAALADATAPISSTAIAVRFKQGRRIEPKVSVVLSALSRMGLVAAAEAGKGFHLRRVG
jgi:hypothetical protein